MSALFIVVENVVVRPPPLARQTSGRDEWRLLDALETAIAGDLGNLLTSHVD